MHYMWEGIPKSFRGQNPLSECTSQGENLTFFSLNCSCFLSLIFFCFILPISTLEFLNLKFNFKLLPLPYILRYDIAEQNTYALFLHVFFSFLHMTCTVFGSLQPM